MLSEFHNWMIELPRWVPPVGFVVGLSVTIWLREWEKVLNYHAKKEVSPDNRPIIIPFLFIAFLTTLFFGSYTLREMLVTVILFVRMVWNS